MATKQFIKLTKPHVTPLRNSLSFIADVKWWVSENNADNRTTSPLRLLSIAHSWKWKNVPSLIVAPPSMLFKEPYWGKQCFRGSGENSNPQEKGNTHVLDLCVFNVFFFSSLFENGIRMPWMLYSWVLPLPLPSLNQIPWPVYSFQGDFHITEAENYSASQLTPKNEDRN